MKTDQILIEEVKSGHVASFSILVSRHQRALLRFALRLMRDLELAEDIVQESFIKAFQKINGFEGRSSFKSWIYQITLNTARNKMRGKKYDHVEVSNVNLSVAPMAESGVAQEDIQGLLKQKIEELPDKQRVALNLRVYEDLSFKEIADIMDCPYDTAKANYRHALLKLRHALEEDERLIGWRDIDWIGSSEQFVGIEA